MSHRIEIEPNKQRDNYDQLLKRRVNPSPPGFVLVYASRFSVISLSYFTSSLGFKSLFMIQSIFPHANVTKDSKVQ